GGYGGAIYNDGGKITILNSTLEGNHAGKSYGGHAIYHDGDSLEIFNSTIALNQDGSLAALALNDWGGLRNVGLDNNVSCSGGPILDIGGNIAYDGSCAFTDPHSRNSTDPKLGPLQNNGGPTQTMTLLPGSPAIGAAVNCPPPAIDQRRQPRTPPCDS